MTRQDLASALRLLMPNTDISAVNNPAEAILFNFEPDVTYGLKLYVTMEQVEGREGEDAVAFVHDRVNHLIDDLTKKDTAYIRKVVNMPDMPTIVRERAIALLASDRERIARMIAELSRTQALADALAAAIGETTP